MDNRTEGRTGFEEVNKVPKHWKFPGKYSLLYPIRVVDRIDLKNRFLVVKGKDVKFDYFFSEQGQLLYGRMEMANLVLLTFGGDTNRYFSFHNFKGQGEFGRPVNRISFSLPRMLMGEPMESEDSLGDVTYINGKIRSISLGDTFDQDKEAVKIASPTINIVLDEDKKGLAKEDWRYGDLSYKDRQNFTYVETEDKRNEVKLAKGKDLVYRIQWEVEGDSMVVKQTHIPTGVVKVIKAPIRIDIEKIKEPALAKTYYKKGKSRELIMPWKNIDRIIGVNLTYSDQSKKQEGYGS